jgi:hypothetical protein
VIHQALDLGMTLIDTADVYGPVVPIPGTKTPKYLATTPVRPTSS